MLPGIYEKFLNAAQRSELLRPDQLAALRPWMERLYLQLCESLQAELHGTDSEDISENSETDSETHTPAENVARRAAAGDTTVPGTTARFAQLLASSKVQSHLNMLCEKRLQELMQHEHWLNRWQVQQLLQGRTRFTLGTYKIVDFIGRGGMGNVFKGIHHLLRNEVAIKILPREKTNAKSVGRFRAEVHTLSSLSHPRLVRAFDAGFEGHVHYLVTEYIPGQDLRKKVQNEGALSMSEAASIITQVASALAYAHHRGIIHRDVKPANILVTPEGIAKLSDLGLVGFQDSIPGESWLPEDYNDTASSTPGLNTGAESDSTDASLTEKEGTTGSKSEPVQSTTNPTDTLVPVSTSNVPTEVPKPAKTPRKVVGTRDYLPPDAIRDPKHPTPAWDIYSLGCTLYYAVTGQVPFPGLDPSQKLHAQLHLYPADPRKLNPNLSEPFVERLGTMIRKSPEHRCESAQRVIEMFTPWLA
ncbi:MAG: serine/threonine-protein kinase [Thermoguttaceae bacterium]|nr:serine/threonine-protein kinase [Thermoguttaceae bacterium]